MFISGYYQLIYHLCVIRDFYMLTIEIITEYNKLESIKEIWNELLRKSHNDTPYLTYQWFTTAWECLDNDKELHIIVVKDDGEIIAIVPFLILRKKFLGISFNKLSFIRNANTPFQDFILTTKKEESIALILNYLKEKSHLWNLIELDEMRTDSITIELLKNICSANKLFYFEKFKHNSWYLPLEHTWEEGLAKLKSKTRKEFKRKLNRLERLGDLKLEIVTDIEQINKHLKIFFDLHERTWKGREQNSELYFQIAKIFSNENKFFLYTLLLNNNPIAYLYTIKIDKILYGIKTTYDPSYYAFSPGIVLFYKSIEQMYNQNDIEEFEIGRGEEQFKRDWTDLSYKQILLYLGNRRLVNAIFFIFKFKLLPFCRRDFFCKYLIPVFKRPIQFLLELNQRIKNEGLLNYLKNVILRLKLNISEKVEVDILKLNISTNGKKQVELENLEYKFAQSDDQDRLAVAMKAINLKQISQRFDQKDKCLIVLKNNEILHYFWFAYHEIFINEINESVKLKSDQVFLYDYSAINNSTFKNVFQTMCEELAEEDKKEILTAINLTNQEAGKNFRELGFKRYNRIVKRRIFFNKD